MDITIVSYNDTLEKEWDSFVAQSVNGTFLHSRAFFRHNPLNDTDDASVLFYKKNRLIGVVPAVMYQRNDKTIYHSHLRSTYGGLVVSFAAGTADIIAMLSLLKEFGVSNSCDEMIMRQPFAIYSQAYAGGIEYGLWQAGFGVKAREIELAIELSDDFAAGYDSSTERSLRKAKKSGIIVNESGNLEAYWEILTDNLMNRHGVKPVHSLEQIKTLISCVGAEKIRLFTAELDGATIGGILVFVANSKVTHAQYIASDSRYQDLRPLNMIIDHIAHWSRERGYAFFNLGMANEPGGAVLNEGLARFKEGYGARGVLRETMSLQLKN